MGLKLPEPTIESMVNNALSESMKEVACPFCLGKGCTKCSQDGCIVVWLICPDCGEFNFNGFITCKYCGTDLII